MAAPLFLAAVAVMAGGCSTPKSKEVADHHRGWIGGQYEVVRQFPPAFKNPPKAALLITALRTNTPARLAGLSEGDLILELNHQPATGLRKFYQTIDGSEPGTALPVKAWRDGQAIELLVPVGRETYKRWLTLGIGLPPKFSGLQPWPSPDFSLVALGYETESLDRRLDLGSPSESYSKSCDPKDYAGRDEAWSAWLAIFQAEVSKRIRCQENVPSRDGSPPPHSRSSLTGR